VALLHDLCTLVGMFAVLRFWLQVNSPFIAALLTVLGYSIHDTIVIFDRIRENLRLRKGRTFAETVNISLLETLARSVNTILTVLLTLLALLFFGGSTLRDFVAAMLIGVIVGGYSSIFVASQLLVSWSKGKEREILPVGETMAGLIAKETIAAPVTAGVAPTVTMTQAPASVSAVQRARQAGKTAKRKR
jgi:preprotein translocase subunit SecF